MKYSLKLKFNKFIQDIRALKNFGIFLLVVYLQALNSIIVAVSITRVIVGGCQPYFVRQKVFPWNLAHQRGSVKILDKAPMPII